MEDICDCKPGAVKLFAKWRPFAYTVVYNGNGAESGSMGNSIFEIGKGYTLTANAYKRTGYTFIGWALEPEGNVVLENKASIRDLTVDDGETVTLYAVFKPNMVEIEFNGEVFRVTDTAIDPITFAEQTYQSCCQAPNEEGVIEYDGKCLRFSYYYAGCLVNGIDNPDLNAGQRGKHAGLSISTEQYSDPQKMLGRLYDLLNTGKPQVIMVEAITHENSRHFVTVVGYKASVTDRDSICQEDLLIIDSFDGALESMDPEISPEGTRQLYRQHGRYRIEAVR